MPKAIWLVVAVLGCGAPRQPPAPRATPPVERSVASRPAAHVAPPSEGTASDHPMPSALTNLAFDVQEELRWPLTPGMHPVMEPAYPIAPIFADSGVGWADLCARGVQNRSAPSISREHLSYLRGWCHAGNRQVDRALDELGPLRHARVPRLAEAVRIDIANILAGAGPADQAQKQLARANIDDLAVYDLLAAAYVEVGSTADASELNDQALDGGYGGTTPAARCHRLARRIALQRDPSARPSKADLSSLGESGDRECQRLRAHLQCSIARQCEDWVKELGVPHDTVFLFDTHYLWSEAARGRESWRSVMERALMALPVPGAEDVAIAALKLCTDDDSCNSRVACSAAGQLKNDPSHDASRNKELATLVDDECNRRLVLTPP
jgi:hypothetical protein